MEKLKFKKITNQKDTEAVLEKIESNLGVRLH
jgi:hypothetical protein